MKKRDVSILLAREIKNLRKQKGLSQKGLAQRSGLSLKVIKGLEEGRQDLDLNALRMLSEGLEIEISDLLRFKEERSSGDRIKKDILAIIRQIKDKQKLELILEFLQALK